MDHTPGHSSPAHVSADYQPLPHEETQDDREEESQQTDLEDPTTSEPETSGNGHADSQDGEMPRIERHGEEESQQADLGYPITSESETSEDENVDSQGGEMPRMERHGLDLGTILGDVAAVASPAALIVFAVMVLCLDGSEASETSYAKWNNATTVLGSLFPIILASTVGRLVYEVARWKLEQGVTLGTLEQLLGSQTVGSTVLTHAKLSAMNPLGAELLFIWIFSPLGGQSLLRILDSRLEPVVQNSTIIHFDPDATSILAPLGLVSEVGYSISDDLIRYLGNCYSPLLLAPPTIKTDSMDLWGNVKIPFLSEETDHHDWSQVSWSPEPEYFSSFAGYPVANVSMGNSTFSMQTSSLELNCSKQQHSMWDFQYDITFLQEYYGLGNVTYQNGTIYGTRRELTSTTWNFGVDRFVDPFWLNSSHLLNRLPWDGVELRKFIRPLIFEDETGIESKAANLFFDAQILPGGSAEEDWPYTIAAKCEMKQKYIESRVSCSRSRTTLQNCTVVAQRPSRQRHASEDISLLSFPSTLKWVSMGLPIAAGTAFTGRADLSMRHLADSKSGHTTKTIGIGAFEKLSDALFSRRLSQLFNTYLVLSQTDMGTQGTINGMQFFSENVTTLAQVSNLVQKYTISKLWITLCFVSCIVLLCSGVLSVVFAHVADGPEILGYASTAVRDSKFVELLPEVGTMTAIDITKTMRGERLRYGITHLTRKGKRLLGVGREAETEQIKDRFDSGV
ncbi:hypothetical protein LCI18_005834 [Fusarium solani-melongenae]|uniref:Uncharacterized protein n=1 Tax=Fusarium solani subsp. cucurbitae TaxID=2747967 RepID=A0ACD3Z0X7_FUSSC|nr:hypothetical protein LCI18_005834 [Fusarium solani-melongenae]